MWCRTVQLAAITIAYVIYSEPPPKEHKNTTSGCWWKMAQRIWSGFTVGCTDICEWLERNLPPPQIPRSQRRKVMTALRTHQSRSRTATIAMSVLAMQANATIASERRVTFDTDSEAVGVDNRCSGCISHVKSDFVGELRTCHRSIKGFGGTRTYRVKMGTLKWSWDDDTGSRHTFLIPDSYYVPDGKVRLLSPQHWAQSQSKNRRLRATCGERTDGNECVLFWNNGRNNLHIDLSRHSNVATFPLAHGYKQFKVFCSEAGMDPTIDDDIVAMPTSLISDNEDNHDDVLTPVTHL